MRVIWWIIIIAAVIITAALVLAFVWPGWLLVDKNDEPVGCINQAAPLGPSGFPAIYAPGEKATVGDRTYVCVGDPTSGKFTWEVEEAPATETSTATPSPTTPTIAEILATPAPLTTTVETKPVDIWFGDNFGGLEKAFPDSVDGPAIAEIWDPETGLCALILVNYQEKLDWKKSGAYWSALTSEGDPTGQKALSQRGPHHWQEYRQKNPKCQVFNSVKEFQEYLATIPQ